MRPENRTGISIHKSERGNVLVYTVLSAFFLFMAVGLGVDLSHLYL
jgi:Flp pilus assembly protein TadG